MLWPTVWYMLANATMTVPVLERGRVTVDLLHRRDALSAALEQRLHATAGPDRIASEHNLEHNGSMMARRTAATPATAPHIPAAGSQPRCSRPPRRLSCYFLLYSIPPAHRLSMTRTLMLSLTQKLPATAPPPLPASTAPAGSGAATTAGAASIVVWTAAAGSALGPLSLGEETMMPMSLQVSSGICTSFRPKRCFT